MRTPASGVRRWTSHWTVLATGLALHVQPLGYFRDDCDCDMQPAANPSTFSNAGMEDAGKTEEDCAEGFARNTANANRGRF
jgi:hypothetical protein